MGSAYASLVSTRMGPDFSQEDRKIGSRELGFAACGAQDHKQLGGGSASPQVFARPSDLPIFL
jgi:hypothetical protein